MKPDLSTTYLGMTLKNPIVPGASPLADTLDSALMLEDAGAPAIVLRSLFEEQIEAEAEREASAGVAAAGHDGSQGRDGSGRRDGLRKLSGFEDPKHFFPPPDDYAQSVERYLKHVQALKRRLGVPVIASLNGSSLGGWLRDARLIEEAGADALELNLYELAANPAMSAVRIEAESVEIVATLKRRLRIPVAVKISPFYTALANFARELESAGAQGMVLFNRFYQPEMDIETRDVRRALELSTSAELPLRLRWLAILSARSRMSFAASGGAHTVEDVVKATMAGAHVTQVVSALLAHGPARLKRLISGLEDWLMRHDYAALAQIQGIMNLESCPDARAYERANYIYVIQGYGK